MLRGADMSRDVLYALGLTMVAGAATGVGAIIVLFIKNKCTKLLCATLGFSAGVMIYVSMAEIFDKGKQYLISVYGEEKGYIYITLAFFAGMIGIGVIDSIIPSTDICLKNKENSLKRMGMMTALAIAIHNFPEGMVTFIAALKNPMLGVAICAAIAIHNIPEGIATAVPICYSGVGRKKAFCISLLTGITEPIGALVGYTLLKPLLNDMVFGLIFGIIAGVMVYISIEELLPMARAYDSGRLSMAGCMCGMGVMAVSLVLLA